MGWCAADTDLGFYPRSALKVRKSGKRDLRGPLRTELLAIPDQWRTAPLRGVYPRAARSADPGTLRRIRETSVKLTPMFESLPYRPCVGAVVFNRHGRVFIGRRIDGPEHVDQAHAWQL